MSTPERSERPSGQATGHQGRLGKPVVDENARAAAREMAKAYEDRPTAVLPGSDRTVTGTAVNEWLDEEGRPICGNEDNAEIPHNSPHLAASQFAQVGTHRLVT